MRFEDRTGFGQVRLVPRLDAFINSQIFDLQLRRHHEAQIGRQEARKDSQLADKQTSLVQATLQTSIFGVELLSFLATALLRRLVKYAETFHEVRRLVNLERVRQVAEQEFVRRQLGEIFDLCVARRVDHRAIFEIDQQLL